MCARGGWKPRHARPLDLTPPSVARPIPIPSGVVMAKVLARSGLSVRPGSIWTPSVESRERMSYGWSIALNSRHIRSESLVGRPAIRIPSERPSKSWWKTMAMTREAENRVSSAYDRHAEGDSLNSDPLVIDRVKPMTSECIMMPSWSTFDRDRQRKNPTRRDGSHQYSNYLSSSAYLRLRGLSRVGGALLVDAFVVHLSVPMPMPTSMVLTVDAVHPAFHIRVRVAVVMTATASTVTVLPILAPVVLDRLWQGPTRRWKRRISTRMRMRVRVRRRAGPVDDRVARCFAAPIAPREPAPSRDAGMMARMRVARLVSVMTS